MLSTWCSCNRLKGLMYVSTLCCLGNERFTVRVFCVCCGLIRMFIICRLCIILCWLLPFLSDLYVPFILNKIQLPFAASCVYPCWNRLYVKTVARLTLLLQDFESRLFPQFYTVQLLLHQKCNWRCLVHFRHSERKNVVEQGSLALKKVPSSSSTLVEISFHILWQVQGGVPMQLQSSSLRIQYQKTALPKHDHMENLKKKSK